MPPNFPQIRDGERRTYLERRRGARLRQRIKQAAGWASAAAAIVYCLVTLGRLGGAAFHLAVAAQQLNAAVTVMQPEIAQIKAREDSIVTNQALFGSHLTKIDSLEIQQQRAIENLTRVERASKRP